MMVECGAVGLSGYKFLDTVPENIDAESKYGLAFVKVGLVIHCIHLPYDSLLVNKPAVACVALSIIGHVDLGFAALLDAYIYEMAYTNRRNTGG